MVAHSCHGKSKSLTARANHSRQKQITHGKSKSLTARANHSWQKQITHGKSKSLTAKANRSRQKQIVHGKSNFTQRSTPVWSGLFIFIGNFTVCRRISGFGRC